MRGEKFSSPPVLLLSCPETRKEASRPPFLFMRRGCGSLRRRRGRRRRGCAAGAAPAGGGLLRAAPLRHGLGVLSGRLRMASLDHAMWFHHDFRFDDWVLYVVESPAASGARTLSTIPAPARAAAASGAISAPASA